MTDLERVRLEIGDDTAPYTWTDDQINEKLAQRGDWRLAAADMLHLWAIKVGREPKFQVGRFSEDPQAAAKFLQSEADRLEALVRRTGTGVFVGGISVADKTTRADDTDRPADTATMDMTDNPDAGWER